MVWPYFFQHRFLFAASVGDVGTARREGASFREASEIRGQTRDNAQLAFPGQVQPWYRCQKSHSVRMSWVAVYGVGRTGFHKLTGIHYVHPVNVAGYYSQVMGNNNQGCAELGFQVTHYFQKLGLYGDIERMGSLRDGLQESLRPFGIKQEKRTFRPHLTLGRFRKVGRGLNHLEALFARHESLISPACPLNELILFKSDLKPIGAVYTKLTTFPLKEIDD